jgi:YL1 nuclear protein/YL1 nuclear protein C-terminal domain
MSAVVPQQRERRKTAGQRMTSLVGNAQDEDDAFWGHDTWADDASSSGNESFRDSDQDSTLRKDEFDSDFNDSETDHEDEEEAAGRQEERELQQQERSNRQGGKNNYVEQRVAVKPGRGLFHKPKRAMGNGINAGLVLNLPPSMRMESTTSAAASGGLMATGPESATLPLVPDSSVSSMPPGGPVPSLSSTHPLPPPATKSPRKTKELGVGKNSSTLVTARQRRSQTKKRDSRNSTPIYSDAPASQQHNNNNNNTHKRPRSQMGVTHKSKRRRYMQEELLVEAVQETEPENQRWLLARKRVQDSADQDKDTLAALREKQRGKNVIQKYHSRRGCLVTLTFPEMDAVPELFTRKSETPSQPERLVCVITGKPAKYRDPKTGKGYYDTAAFKELRKRHDAGVPLDQRPKSKPKPKDDDAISVSGPGESSTQDAASKPVLSPKPTTGFVLDLGGDKKSPGSTRSSARKWKPSEKMLTGMGIIHTAEDGTSSSSHSEKVEDLLLVHAPPLLPPIRSRSSDNPLEEKKAVTSAAAEGGIKVPSIVAAKGPSVVAAKGPSVVAAKSPAVVAAKAPAVAAKAPAVAAAKTPAVAVKTPSVATKAPSKAPSVATKAKAPSVVAKGSASVESKPPGERTAQPSGEPGLASNSRPNGKVPSAAAAEKRRSNGNGAASAPTSTLPRAPTLLAPSNVQIPVTHPSEPVYVIPGDSDSGSAEPKYVTQSELIMQAISNYNRSTMDPNKSQNHDPH